MKVLFAVSNDNITTSVVNKYQQKFKEIITSKNVYYFNAIMKELQRDKTYDAIVIGEDLEPISNNNNYDSIDKFLFEKLDGISDEASKVTGEDIPIIFICSDRRVQSDQLLIKLFGIGIYNAIIGNDRSIDTVCNLINKPRNKKEAKMYYKVEAEEVGLYERGDDQDVSETEIQNILAHYRKIGLNEKKCVESFDSIADQYSETQLRIIIKFLPNDVKAILEANSDRYNKLVSKGTVLSNGTYQAYQKQDPRKPGQIDVLTKDIGKSTIKEPVIIPSTININKKGNQPNQMQGNSPVMPNQMQGRPPVMPNQMQGNPPVMPNQMQGRPPVMPNQMQGRPPVMPNQMQGRPPVMPNQMQGRPPVMPNQMQGRPSVMPNQMQGNPPVMPNQMQSNPPVMSNQIQEHEEPMKQSPLDSNIDMQQVQEDAQSMNSIKQGVNEDMQTMDNNINNVENNEPKRGRGRPRKIATTPISEIPMASNNNIQGLSQIEPMEAKRGRGRPRKVISPTVMQQPVPPLVQEPVQPVAPVMPDPIVPVAPVVPEPVQPVAPVMPEPVEPVAPVMPEPVEPIAPVMPEPVMPEPVQPIAPVMPEPVEPIAPVMPEPVEPVAPVMPEPIEPVAPVMPEPIEPVAPVMPEPVEPEAPVIPEPVEPEAPVMPEQNTSNSSTELPGFEDILPGLEEDNQENDVDLFSMDNLDNSNNNSNDNALPGFENDMENNNSKNENSGTNLFDLDIENEQDDDSLDDLDSLLGVDSTNNANNTNNDDNNLFELDNSENNNTNVNNISNQNNTENINNTSSLNEMDNINNEPNPFDTIAKNNTYTNNQQNDPFGMNNQNPYDMSNQNNPYEMNNQNNPLDMANQGNPFDMSNQSNPYDMNNQSNPYDMNNQNNPFEVNPQNNNNTPNNDVNDLFSLDNSDNNSFGVGGDGFANQNNNELLNTSPEPMPNNNLVAGNGKIVAFVGTTKNGTSFIVNNLAQLLSQNGIKTAILDLTKNKNSYYMFTDNDANLMKKATDSIKNLSNGIVDGLEVNKNLTVFTSLPEEDDMDDKNKVLQTLSNSFDITLLDCDFVTSTEFFVNANEIYLIQTMDTFTIQPLTQFLSELKLKNILDESKLRVVINKYVKLKKLDEKLIIGGMSKYNEPSMTLQRDLFNAATIKYVNIPFSMETYMKYLEAIAMCNLNLNGYPQDFLMALEQLKNMVYPLIPGGNIQNNNTDDKHGLFGAKKGKQPQSTQFSNDVNDTLNRMRTNNF